MSMRPAPTPATTEKPMFNLTWDDLTATEKSAASLGVDPSEWKPISFLNSAHYDQLVLLQGCPHRCDGVRLFCDGRDAWDGPAIGKLTAKRCAAQWRNSDSPPGLLHSVCSQDSRGDTRSLNVR